MEHTHDVLILGRGIAGAVLAEVLMQRGLRVHVYDHKRPGNASMAAAGVLNPVVLKRDVPSWRAHEMLPLAQVFYTSLEKRLGVPFWHPVELVKLFPGEREATQWQKAMYAPGTAPFVDQRAQSELEGQAVNAPHGHGTVHACAWVDVPAMLNAQRRYLLDQCALSERQVQEQDIVHDDNGVRIGAHSAALLVRCTGPFDALAGLVPVKGEGLTLRIPGLRTSRMLHRGVFVLPQPDGTYRVGATFKWDRVWDGPTEEARTYLLGQWAKLSPLPAEVLDHWCGVRPAAADRRPILGRTGPHEGVMNGLGARGVMLAPWCAEHLADHLLHDRPLDPEVRADRAFARHGPTAGD